MSAVAALQDCLAAEHAALYGYGVLGGRLARAARGARGARWRTLADVAYADHRARRDDLTELLVEKDAVPVAAHPAYATPFEVETLSGCRRLARLLESRCSAVYADAVRRTADHRREVSAEALTGCALLAVQWGEPIDAFPGVAEL